MRRIFGFPPPRPGSQEYIKFMQVHIMYICVGTFVGMYTHTYLLVIFIHRFDGYWPHLGSLANKVPGCNHLNIELVATIRSVHTTQFKHTYSNTQFLSRKKIFCLESPGKIWTTYL